MFLNNTKSNNNLILIEGLVEELFNKIQKDFRESNNLFIKK